METWVIYALLSMMFAGVTLKAVVGAGSVTAGLFVLVYK
jgi:hypothetical protein